MRLLKAVGEFCNDAVAIAPHLNLNAIAPCLNLNAIAQLPRNRSHHTIARSRALAGGLYPTSRPVEDERSIGDSVAYVHRNSWKF